MTDMAEDYARYMHAKDLYDNARRALTAVLEDEDARRHLGGRSIFEGYANALIDELAKQSDHIVAVWN